ncbi:MAG: hypothetical protein GYA57_09585 [Myxococcales bacterium]|nr:hypothetical protein [Myxococcales bacterium]
MLGKLRSVFLVFLAVQACVDIGDDTVDPRLGREGRVRFSGGGCAAGSSTTLAVGSTETLTLEPQPGVALPSDLEAGSSAPAVIEATRGSTVDQVVLEAHRAGEARVELRSGGATWDSLDFRAEPAASVQFYGVPAVFAGGTAYVKVEEVYGACGQDCPLLGRGFLRWSAVPATGLTPLRDAGGVAYFAAGEPGEVRVEGREPSGGALLVEHPVQVVPVADAGAVEARILVALPDQTVLDPQPLPAELPAGSLFLIQLEAPAGDRTVPLAGADVHWTVEGDTSAVEPYGDGSEPPAEGPIFSAVAAGSVDMVANIPLLGRTERYALTITAGS